MLISESTEQKTDKKDRWTNFSDGDACAHDEVVRHWGVNRDKCSGRSQPALWRGWHHDDQGTNSTENILVLSLGLNITTKLLNWVTFWARREVKKSNWIVRRTTSISSAWRGSIRLRGPTTVGSGPGFLPSTIATPGMYQGCNSIDIFVSPESGPEPGPSHVWRFEICLNLSKLN